MEGNCGRLFLDCQGLWDLGGEVINWIVTLLVFCLAVRNCVRLSEEGEAEEEQGRRRKLRINLLCVAFLLVLLSEITYSFSAFLLTYDFGSGHLQTNSREASVGYKIVEILCINCLNCLIIYVGYHYWAAVRKYLLSRSAQHRRTCSQLLFRPRVRRVFVGTYLGAGVCVVVSGVLLVFGGGVDENAPYTALNLLNFVVTLLSILIFLFARIQCYYIVQKSQQISAREIRRELLKTSMVVLTCALRIITYWLSIFGSDPAHTLRSPRQTDCYDSLPWHALYIMGLTFLVNLLPAITFILNFKAEKQLSQPLLTEDSFE